MAKILVLDDVKFISVSLRNILSSLGHTDIDICESGTKVLENFKTNGNDYELIFLSLSLPSSNEIQDSIDAVKKLKVLDEDAKIVMIKAVEEHQKVLKAVQAGAVSYIDKPIKLQAVKDILTKFNI